VSGAVSPISARPLTRDRAADARDRDDSRNASRSTCGHRAVALETESCGKSRRLRPCSVDVTCLDLSVAMQVGCPRREADSASCVVGRRAVGLARRASDGRSVTSWRSRTNLPYRVGRTATQIQRTLVNVLEKMASLLTRRLGRKVGGSAPRHGASQADGRGHESSEAGELEGSSSRSSAGQPANGRIRIGVGRPGDRPAASPRAKRRPAVDASEVNKQPHFAVASPIPRERRRILAVTKPQHPARPAGRTLREKTRRVKATRSRPRRRPRLGGSRRLRFASPTRSS